MGIVGRVSEDCLDHEKVENSQCEKISDIRSNKEAELSLGFKCEHPENKTEITTPTVFIPWKYNDHMLYL